MKRSYVIILLSLWSMIAFAQTPTVTAEETEVVSVVKDVFVGMAEGDSARVRAGFRENPAFYSVFQTREGEHVLHTDPEGFEKWLVSIGTPHEEVYNEVLSDIEVRIDGDLAMVWTNYTFNLDEEFHHCGIDLLQLNRDGEGIWKIFQLTDTKRRKNCEE